MMELAIDTSTRYASICAVQPWGESVVELTWRSERNHSVELVPSIQLLLKREGIGVSDLDAQSASRPAPAASAHCASA